MRGGSFRTVACRALVCSIPMSPPRLPPTLQERCGPPPQSSIATFAPALPCTTFYGWPLLEVRCNPPIADHVRTLTGPGVAQSPSEAKNAPRSPMRDKLLVVLYCACSFAIAQPVERDTIAKPRSQKDKKKRDRKLSKELESPYGIWETQD